MRYLSRILLSVLGLAPTLAEAQRVDIHPWGDTVSSSAASVHRHAGAPLVERASGVTGPRMLLRSDDKSRLTREAVKGDDSTPSLGRYVVVGTLAGAALGTAAAFLATHASNVTDHSEDGLAYMVFIPTGALVGAAVGGLLGVISR